jgi:predicted ATPase/DNA-binding SARP family transcriptional activator
MAHLALSVLGELEVLVDDVPVSSFESDKVRALLVYLAVEAGRVHRRETLLGLLWPDYPEGAARHNLSQCLFNLRLAINDHTAKPPYLFITRDAIHFNRDSDYSLDLDQFNSNFVAWGKNRTRESIDSSILLTQLEAMAELYRGEFLQQFFLGDSAEYEAWVIVQRETLHQRAMEAITILVNEYDQQGDYAIARRYALRQLELDPWREEVHCQVMRLLALDGQRSAALAQYEICRKVLAAELGVEPSSQTRDLYEQIRLGTLKPKAVQATPVPSAPIHNLPVPLTPFVGREQELADLARLIADPECRCISLVGPGGVGKTRLALQAADQRKNEFAEGTAIIPLASVGSVDAVIPAIANGIGFDFYGPLDPKIQLLKYLRDKQMLLIVDNVEHLLAEESQPGSIADLLIEILQQDALIKLLVTSREALNLQGELSFEVQGLAFPGVDQTEGLDEFSAVALFVQRARRARPGFELNDENKTGVIRLCRMVEGLPLAIELAAAWVRVLSPEEIAKEIETSLDILNAQMRDLPERHRSMRAVFDHSWQMLSTEEQEVLSKLSVFRGGFQRQAAEQVAGASLPVLSSLVIRSLLRRMVTGRYDLHELIRQYAASNLGEDPDELHMVQERHSHYYLGLLEEKGVKLQSHDQKEVVAELTVEMDNLRTAWDWSIADLKFIPLFRVSATLWYLFEQLNWFKEGEATFQKTGEALRIYLDEYQAKDPVLRTALNAMLAHWGYFTFRQGRGEEAYAILAPSAAFLRTSTEPIAATNSLFCLGIVCWILGRYSEAEESLQESLTLARERGERWYEAMAGEFLGRVAIEQGAYNQARQYLGEALAIMRQLGDPSMTAHALSYLGRTMQILGEYSQAEKLARESLELARGIGYRTAVGLSLDGLGNVAYSQGKHQEARAFFLESASLFREMGDTHRLSRTLNHQGFNSLSLDDAAEAQNDFISALRMAHEGGFFPSALNALVGLAELEARQKTSGGTFELVLYILQHPASTQETKNRAERLRVELNARLPQPEIESAQQRVGSMSLDELVHQFLAGI